MPNKFTAKHNPPIESVLKRALFIGPQQAPLWDVRQSFDENGVSPDAGYAIMLVGVNAMVYHHSTSEDEKGRKSAVISIPSTPFVLVCDAAAIEAKPFGQQSHDYFLAKMRQQGLEPCGACGGTGFISQVDKLRPWLPTMGQCMTCEGRGFVPIQPKDRGPDAPARQTIGDVMAEDPDAKAKIVKLMNETGANMAECSIALMAMGGDYDRALKWMDDSRLKFKTHAPDCPGAKDEFDPCSPTCPLFKEPS
jgi:hypothetical protein